MKYLFTLFIFLASTVSLSAQFKVVGGVGEPYLYTKEGLTNVYLLNTLSGAYLEYTSSEATIEFFKYSSSGGAVQIPLSDMTVIGDVYRINNIEDGWGYMAKNDGLTISSSVWIINYKDHMPVLLSVEPENGEDVCEGLRVHLNKEEQDLNFYYVRAGNSDTYTPKRLEYKYRFEYDDLEWSKELKVFNDKEIISEATYGPETTITSPLKDTRFLLTDVFARELGLVNKIESNDYTALRVEAHTDWFQITDTGEEVSMEGQSEGLSAPVTLKFYGYANEPTANYYLWYEYYLDPNTNDTISYEPLSEQIAIRKYEKAGKYVLRLVVANSGSEYSCTNTNEEITFTITESELKIPNFFSPGDSPGVNDEFKVVYKSLIKFKCTIFNRWGNKVYEFNDPEQGWDGKYKGKLVNPGVYFYVIDALGSDGIKYKKGGDINIIRGK